MARYERRRNAIRKIEPDENGKDRETDRSVYASINKAKYASRGLQARLGDGTLMVVSFFRTLKD